MTDEAIVNRVRGGDREAFALLVDRYRNTVYGLAFYHLRSAEDARDVAQEAFIQAFQRLGQLQEPAKFAPWLRQADRERLPRSAAPPDTGRTDHDGGRDGRHGVDRDARVVVEAAPPGSPLMRLTLTPFLRPRTLPGGDRRVPRRAGHHDQESPARRAARLRKELMPMLEETLMPEPLPADFTVKVMHNFRRRARFTTSPSRRAADCWLTKRTGSC